MEPPINPLQPKKANIASILICCDFLATRRSEQVSNLRWVSDLLERPIKAACPGISVRFGLDDFDHKAVLQNALPPGQEKERHRWFDPERIEPKELKRLSKTIGEQTLIIGYELSRATRRALTRASVPWIDIWLHPVRFSDDILFAFRASDPQIQSRLEAFEVQEETFFAQADLLRIQNYRGFAKLDQSLADGSALFVGQTARDKSVLAENGFLSLLDFEEPFRALCRAHPHVYFSRHPNEPRLSPGVSRLIGKFDNVSEVDAPTYHVLAAPEISTVASISSSVLEEARFFGKDVVRFHPAPFDLDGDHRYITILQDFCFSYFWAEVLADLADVQKLPKASFIAPRNKLRHALSFYWGYRDIDRYEHLGRTQDASPSANQTAPTLKTADIVSFDVFDTLITRRVASPKDVFELMAEDAAPLLGIAPASFADRRVTAERIATEQARQGGREDPTLNEIYQSLLKSGADDPRLAALTQLEISVEEKVTVRREAGWKLFKTAAEQNRRIILVSDMYLPRDAVESLLSDCGYEGWEELYLSSERGKTKRTGRLFEEIIFETGIDPAGILHIGDNRKGDVEVPRRLGIACHPLPAAIETLEGTAPYFRKASTTIRSEGLHSGSAIIAQVANRYFDAGTTSLTDDLGGDAEAFGYIALGPLITGFAIRIAEEAARDGVKRLAFLTREGPLFRAAFDTLFPETDVETATVFASRRMVRSASFESADDVDAVTLPGSEQNQNVADLFNVEFGLPRGEVESFLRAAVNADGGASQASNETSQKQLHGLVEELTERILENSRQSRATLRAYLEDVGLSGVKAAVVDIGYAGRVQAAFSKILGTRLGGYYAVTLRSSSDVLGDLSRSGYLGSYCTPGDRRVGLCRHRRLYETFLCAPGQSIIAVEKRHDGWRGIPEIGHETPVRDDFVAAAHKGALEFVRDYVEWNGPMSSISPSVATAFLDSMLDDPTDGLARFLGALEFDDPFGSRGTARLIDDSSGPDNSIWPEGARKLLAPTKNRSERFSKQWQWAGPYGLLGWRHLMTPIVAAFVARIGDVQDADHYRDDPIGFFRRLSDPRYRRIGKLLYPRD